MKKSRYGSFQLTDAVRPAPGVTVAPRQAYRIGLYRDQDASLRVPVLAASVSRELLFDVFLDLLEPLGQAVDIVLETSHEGLGANHKDLYRGHIDMPVLQSHLCEFENLLLNDGCTGFAAIAQHAPLELQFDEHKLLIAYAHDLSALEAVMHRHHIPRDDRLQLISEAEHLHATEEHFREEFFQLSQRLGVSESAQHVSW